MGLNCYTCGGATKITDTRTHTDPDRDFLYVMRYHRCYDCGLKFKSMETYMELWQTLLEGEQDNDPGSEGEEESSQPAEGNGGV